MRALPAPDAKKRREARAASQAWVVCLGLQRPEEVRRHRDLPNLQKGAADGSGRGRALRACRQEGPCLVRRPGFTYPPPGPVPAQAWILLGVVLTVLAAAVLR